MIWDKSGKLCQSATNPAHPIWTRIHIALKCIYINNILANTRLTQMVKPSNKTFGLCNTTVGITSTILCQCDSPTTRQSYNATAPQAWQYIERHSNSKTPPAEGASSIYSSNTQLFLRGEWGGGLNKIRGTSSRTEHKK